MTQFSSVTQTVQLHQQLLIYSNLRSSNILVCRNESLLAIQLSVVSYMCTLTNNSFHTLVLTNAVVM